MTTNQATDLKETLESMMNAIAQKEPVTEHLLQLTRLQQEIAPTASPQLNHYLQNRSYTKALDYLKNGIVLEDPNRPDCDEEHP